MPADSSLALHRNPIAYGIRIAIVICGVLLAALLADRIFFVGDHLQVRFFAPAPAAVTLLRDIPLHHTLAVVPVDPDTPTARVVEGAPPESILAF